MSFYPEEYDSWYERHRDEYELEIEALKRFTSSYENPMLEIGVGTGRFAHALGIEYGIDPDEKMLEFAKKRGIKVKRARGEEIPFPDGFFNMVLISTTLSFLSEPIKVIQEAHRVLREGGGLIIGFIPRDSKYGRKYEEMKKSGDPRFKNAHFYTLEEVKSLIDGLFEIRGLSSTLIEGEKGVKEFAAQNASFVVIHAVKI